MYEDIILFRSALMFFNNNNSLLPFAMMNISDRNCRLIPEDYEII